ncbi:hypothetical protein [Streptomyces sp. NEAU-174]|uniref:hypothetical protein n=1 Tax=Streptomyces sp. NEAU-174 TaxID=3458254 RepID=UPI0040450E0F
MRTRVRPTILTLAATDTVVTTLRAAIQALPVGGEDRTGYGRTKHWVDEDADGCTTRHEVLLAEAVVAVCRTVRKRGELARDLRADPGLLTGGGAQGSAQMVRFIDALPARGARAVVRPTCPGCGREGVYAPLNDVRVCRSCLSRKRREPCGRCGKERPVGSRDMGGTAVCHPCLRADPANHEACSGCGRLAWIVRRVQQGGLCGHCYRLPVAVCSACDRTRPCLYATTDHPRCEPCNNRLRETVVCSACGRERPVETRGPDGQPLCANCARARRHQPCSQCGHRRRVGHRTADGAVLCRACFATHPDSRRPCQRCADVTRLHHRGLCPSCALADLLDHLLADPDGTVPSRLGPVAACLMRGEPTPTLRWLQTHPGPPAALKALATSGEPVTHQLLDGLRPAATVAYLRAALVADGVLPPRDEQLATLERWLPRELARLETAADRQAVHSFATWHHFKRLRRLPSTTPTTYYQALSARRDIQAATSLIRWLRDRGTSLADATQHDIDTWLTGTHYLRYVASTFVSWAVTHRRAQSISRTNGDGPMPVIGHDRRWALVRRLLHDADLTAATRVAGLLLLLYAQPVSRTARLRLDQITRTDDTVYLALGPVPTALPDPLAQLVLDLADRRHGHGTLGRRPDHPWLVPGLSAGEPISASRLTISLNKLGIRARPARNTTLIELTAELPPVVLARLLGLNINSAERWSAEAAANRTTYATDLARRPGRDA